ncbi:hypothetical protein HYQ44_003494 [Verticillium longisporum]|nr:hypothetical protein HYQ44_003494 [Verticillium longisporum]
MILPGATVADPQSGLLDLPAITLAVLWLAPEISNHTTKDLGGFHCDPTWFSPVPTAHAFENDPTFSIHPWRPRKAGHAAFG